MTQQIDGQLSFDDIEERMNVLLPNDPIAKRLVEVLTGIPADHLDDVRAVTLRIAAGEIITVTVEHVVEVDEANDVIHTFEENRILTVGDHG